EALALRCRQDGRRTCRVPLLAGSAHEGGRLGAIVGVLLGEQGDQHEERQVDEERPEDPVRGRVETTQAEERRRLEPGEAPWSLGEDRGRDQALLDERRD